MTAYLLTNHLLNFMAPAALLAVLLVLVARLFSGFFRSKRPIVHAWWAQVAIVFVANMVVLAAGLLFFGHDGKMLTYAGLTLGAALCQWVLLRGWKA
ncbi:MAG TPA: hypothetical protein VGJ72_20040 [Polaromonas sp.]|jgi:hypothetical protein